MHERSNWQRPAEHAGSADRGRRPEDRPYWWRDDNLPFHHDDEWADRAYEEGREREARHRDHEDDPRRRESRHRDDDGASDGRHRRSWGEKATHQVKAMFGSERADRRHEPDREAEAREEREEQRDEHRDRRDFRGVGPRMRHDEDEDLREEICDRLRDDPELDAADILVRVIDNEAILDGTVRSKRDAERAHHLADDVRGIVFVRDRLRAGRSSDDRVRRATIGMGYDDSPSRRGRRRN